MMRIASLVTTGIAVLIGITILFGSWFTIDQTERGVMLRNGAFTEVVQPGLHFKMPWVESVYKIDMQTHTVQYGYKDHGTFEAYSADQQPASLALSVTYHVDPAKVADVYNRFGGDLSAAVSRLIQPRVYQEVKVVFGQYSAQKAITERGKLNVDAAAALAAAISYDPIFVIEGVQIEDISFSQDYIKAVEQRMQAEIQVTQQEQQLRQEKIKADITVTQANGRAQSVIAEAKAAADATVLKGNAEAAAIKARAEALGQNPNLISLTQAEKWDGRLPLTMPPGGTVPFLNLTPAAAK